AVGAGEKLHDATTRHTAAPTSNERPKTKRTDTRPTIIDCPLQPRGSSQPVHPALPYPAHAYATARSRWPVPCGRAETPERRYSLWGRLSHPRTAPLHTLPWSCLQAGDKESPGCSVQRDRRDRHPATPDTRRGLQDTCAAGRTRTQARATHRATGDTPSARIADRRSPDRGCLHCARPAHDSRGRADCSATTSGTAPGVGGRPHTAPTESRRWPCWYRRPHSRDEAP